MTLPPIDRTHDPEALSWVTGADAGPFPLQNLPFGRFDRQGLPGVGIALGDKVIDLQVVCEAGLLSGEALEAAREATASQRNAMLAIGPGQRRALRGALFELFRAGSDRAAAAGNVAGAVLLDRNRCAMLLPAEIGDFTDFNAGIHHASNGGRRRKLADPLLPNYRHVPIAYHSRASSVCVSGKEVRRPWGQSRPASPDTRPTFGPSAKLDFELELGFWVGRGNALGKPVPIGRAAESIAGFCLLNDWSARDLQGWESERLGPFLGKSFCTTVSPWVVTPEALAPFRLPAFRRAAGDPEPLAYLLDAADQHEGGLDLQLEVRLQTASMRRAGLAAVCIAVSHARHLYWTPAQMLAHHTSNGCNLQVGDLLGTGTVSAPEPSGFGTFLELGADGSQPLAVGDEQRCWLEDGDELDLTATASRKGFVSIGLGECRGRVAPAWPRFGEEAA